MPQALKVWQLIARLRTMPQDAEVIIDDSRKDGYGRCYGVQDDEDGEVALVMVKPESITLEGHVVRPPKIVKVSFANIFPRPAVNQTVELNMGHGQLVQGYVLSFDEYGMADFVIKEPASKPEPKSYAGPDGRYSYMGADYGRQEARAYGSFDIEDLIGKHVKFKF